MICPYCKEDMQDGAIYSDRYALKWIPDKKDKGALLAPFTKGIKLTSMSKDYITVYYCESCNKMIFDIDVEKK